MALQGAKPMRHTYKLLSIDIFKKERRGIIKMDNPKRKQRGNHLTICECAVSQGSVVPLLMRPRLGLYGTLQFDRGNYCRWAARRVAVVSIVLGAGELGN